MKEDGFVMRIVAGTSIELIEMKTISYTPNVRQL